MSAVQCWGKLLLWAHLFVCCVWLYLFHAEQEPPTWVGHVALWSILGVQFTWGFTVGLIVGPSKKRRSLLWWSLLLVFLPLWPVGMLTAGLLFGAGPLVALLYGATLVMIIACETYCGVLLGVRTHAGEWS